MSEPADPTVTDTDTAAARSTTAIPEHVIQREIIAKLSEVPGVRVWRANTGAARTQRGFIRFGIPGQADISGLIGPRGRRLEIEVKSARGSLRPEQRAFRKMIEAHGGLYIVARSVDDALLAVSQAVVGEALR